MCRDYFDLLPLEPFVYLIESRGGLLAMATIGLPKIKDGIFGLDFINKEVTFCIDGEDESWEIWRYVEDNDSDKIKKSGTPENPKYLYVEGEEITEFVNA